MKSRRVSVSTRVRFLTVRKLVIGMISRKKKGLSHTIGSPSIISSLLTLIVKIKLEKNKYNGKLKNPHFK
jgi:hypothetical protein